MGASLPFSREAKKEVPSKSFIPYTGHVTENTVRTASGDLVFVIRVQGAAHESADARDINAWHEQLNGYMRNIASPKVAIWQTLIRREYEAFPDGEFEPGFCADLNTKYQAHVKTSKTYVNELYVSVVYRPEPLQAARFMSKIIPTSTESRSEKLADDLEAVEQLVTASLTALDRYEPELLSMYERNGMMFSEVEEFLAYLLNGVWRRQAVSRDEIRNHLAIARPRFGKGGLLALSGAGETTLGAMVTIQEYPNPTCPGLLNDILSLPCEVVMTQSFTFISKQVGLQRLDRQKSRMENAGDEAISQVDALDDAMDDLKSNRFVWGAHHLSVFVKAPDQKTLNNHVSEVGEILSDAGMKYAREDVGIAGAFYAQLPANFKYRVRVGEITSRNFAGFASMHNYPIGRIRGNQWGDAVTMFQTTSGAPYYFNFHKGEVGAEARVAKLDPNHKDLANTVVIGPPGAGKTVLEGFLLSALQKFRVFPKGHPGPHKLSAVLFDKDMGASIAVRAMRGRYYPIKNGHATGWQPLHLDPTPQNISFLERLYKRLVFRPDMPLTPRDEANVSKGIAQVLAMPKHLRRMSAVRDCFDVTDENGIYARLDRWCEGGPLGWLFDNPQDTLDVDNTPVVGFDVTDFIENEETRTPTIMYLFHRIDSLLDGRRVPIFLDEFPKLLNDPEFESMAGDKLVTIRKLDGFLMMFCQAPKQILGSKIAYAIVEATATKIFLPNPSADRNDYVDGLKLTQREFEIIKSLGEKSRRFLVKQGNNSVVCELNLRGFEDELAVLSGNAATSRIVERIIADLGTDNPDVWLPVFHSVRRGESTRHAA